MKTIEQGNWIKLQKPLPFWAPARGKAWRLRLRVKAWLAVRRERRAMLRDLRNRLRGVRFVMFRKGQLVEF